MSITKKFYKIVACSLTVLKSRGQRDRAFPRYKSGLKLSNFAFESLTLKRTIFDQLFCLENEMKSSCVDFALKTYDRPFIVEKNWKTT